jgi:hypothetical protein
MEDTGVLFDLDGQSGEELTQGDEYSRAYFMNEIERIGGGARLEVSHPFRDETAERMGHPGFWHSVI